jgi:hypothetical protein
MLHVFVFTVVLFLFLASLFMLVAMLRGAAGDILAALQIERPRAVPVRPAPPRVRVVTRSRNLRLMPQPLRAAA